MFEAFALLVGLKSITERYRENEAVVPEPEFTPFRLPQASTPTAGVPLAPRTLEELGVPGPLAREMELVLHLMGHSQGEKVVGYTFRDPDGASHALRLSKVPDEELTERAA